ncbi:MAG: transporter [Nitrospirota bacterium]
MGKLFVILFCLVGILFLTYRVEACDYCILSQGISPLETIRGKGIRVTERYTVLKSVYKGSDKLDTHGAKEEYWTTEFTGFYGISENIMLLAVVPLRKTKLDGHLHVHEDGDVEVESDKGDEFGLGDIALLGRYTFFKTHTIDTTTTIAAIVGVKFPTGKTDGKTGDGANFLDAHLQLGTGSTDFLLGLSLSHAIGRFSMAANLLGSINTEGDVGDKKHQFGNTLNYDLTARYRVYPGKISPLGQQLFLALGVNGEIRGKEKEDGIELTNSGGHTIYISPGIQVVVSPHWVFELSYSHPVYHNLNGIQLGEDYKISGGVTYLFKK